MVSPHHNDHVLHRQIRATVDGTRTTVERVCIFYSGDAHTALNCLNSFIKKLRGLTFVCVSSANEAVFTVNSECGGIHTAHMCIHQHGRSAFTHVHGAHIKHIRTHAHAHTEKHVHPKAALLPPDLSQLEDVQHGLKDPHADGTAPPRLADPPCRVSRDSGRVNRRNVAVVLAALVAVLGA